MHAHLGLDEALEAAAHPGEGPPNLGVVGLAEAGEDDAVEAELALVLGLVGEPPLSGAFPIRIRAHSETGQLGRLPCLGSIDPL